MINAQISHSIETMEIGPEMNLSTIRMVTDVTMEDFLVLHRLEGENFQQKFHTASQEVINLTIVLSADLTIDLRLVLRLTNKSFHQTVFRHHLLWFASPQSTIPLMNYQIFVR